MENANCTLPATEPLAPFLTFDEVGKMFGKKSVKTVGRWVETIPGFPEPVRIGCSRFFIREEMEGFIQKLKDKRDKKKNTL